MSRPDRVEARLHAGGRLRRQGEEKSAFRAEPLDERRRGEAHLTGDVGECEPRRRHLRHGAGGRGKDVVVADGPGSGAHA